MKNWRACKKQTYYSPSAECGLLKWVGSFLIGEMEHAPLGIAVTLADLKHQGAYVIESTATIFISPTVDVYSKLHRNVIINSNLKFRLTVIETFLFLCIYKRYYFVYARWLFNKNETTRHGNCIIEYRIVIRIKGRLYCSHLVKVCSELTTDLFEQLTYVGRTVSLDCMHQ